MDIVEKRVAILFALAFAFCALILLGCKPKEVIASEKTVKDSVFTKSWVEYRDTTILVEADSAAIMALVPGCPDLPQQVSEKGRVKLTVSVKDGQISADCLCKQVEKQLKLMTVNYLTERFRSEHQRDTVVIREKFVPGFTKFLAWSGGIFWVIIILGLVIFIIIKSLKPI